MINHSSFTTESAGFFKKISLLVLLFVFSWVQGQEKSVQDLITEKDSLFWKSYNACDIAGMESHLSEDLEFYHDKNGITVGKQSLSDGLKAGLCSTGSNHLRREAIPQSVSVYPLKNNDSAYGAIITGEHLFYIIEGDSERLDGQARFSNLWLKENGEWKMHRIYSFDHGPAPFKNHKDPIALSKDKLDRLTGDYITSSNDPITVKLNENKLELMAMGKNFILYPENEFSFFTKERDLTFSFSEELPRRLTIFESKNKVAEAVSIQR